MFKLGDNFEVKKDSQCWTLIEKYQGVSKDGQPKEMRRQTYYSTLKQVANAIVDKSMVDEPDAEGLHRSIVDLEDMVIELLEANPEE